MHRGSELLLISRDSTLFDTELIEFVCEENEKDSQHMTGK